MTESLSAAWARSQPFLEAAAKHWGEGSTDEALRRVAAGEAHLWTMPNGAAVSEINRSFHTWLAGGERSELLALHPHAEAWARQNGCDRMTILGRKGWERVMAPLGYRPVRLLVKDLT